MDAAIEAVRVAGTPDGMMPVVLLASEDPEDGDPLGHAEAVLPIFIGFDEAVSIARGLDAVDIGRPLTHDLLLDVMEELGGRVERVVVTEVRDGTYIADLYVDTPRGGATIDARPSEGTDANVGRLDRNESHIGYIQNWTANRIRENEAPFDDLSFTPCQTFHLYNLPWIFATANEDWTSVTDIEAGSRIVPTPRGSGTRPALEHGLDYAVDDYERASIQYGELASALNEGRIDAAAVTILNSDIEPGWVQEMKGSVDLRLLDWPEDAVEEMRDDPALFIEDVDMTKFDGYDYASDTVPSISFAYNFIVRDDLDYDTLYSFMETMYEARGDLSEYNALLGYLEDSEYWVTDMYEGIPFHPAAADFYQEIGVWKDEFERYEE